MVFNCLQVLIYLNRLNADKLGVSVMHMFVLDKEAILTVCTMYLELSHN